MRNFIDIITENLNERVESEYYMHVSEVDNLRSILKHGLISNKTDNYGESRWESLEGVYATCDPHIIRSQLRELSSMSNYIIAVIAITPASVFLDEDHIENHIKNLVGNNMDAALERYQLYKDGEEPSFINTISDKLHDKLKNKMDTRPKPNIINDFVEGFFQSENWQLEDIQWWKDIKRRTSEYYKSGNTVEKNKKESIRIPHDVSFRGRNRIVAIIKVSGNESEIVYGDVPAKIKEKINQI